ncbi:MAG: phosphate ABC transporter permease subunit PstC, partial [Chloroflexi bacterium]|nr:phosphate ABC transporter permease subunit PstC [Chloroflexota bacterium]
MRLRRLKDLLASRLMLSATVFSALLVVFIAIGLFLKAKPILSIQPLSTLLFSSSWHPLNGEFGL